MSYSFVKPTGIFVPDTSELLDEVVAEYKSAFGNDLVVTPDTPQGVLIATETLAREGLLKNTAQIANQINPNVAEGVFLDAIWALTGGRRIPASKTIVEGVELAGVPSSIIPSGSLVQATDTGEQFALIESVVLNNGGYGTGTFQAVNDGQIVCAANTLTQIVTASIGWESVTNPTEATKIGTSLESDEQSRIRRRNTLALNAASPSEAIISSLYALSGVRSVAYRENVKNTTEIIDGITLVAHSVWVCVDGATDDEVAKALLSKKSIGSNWNGAVTVNVTDQWSGQIYPVQFDRPTEVPCMVRVTVRSTGGVSNPAQVVKDAIIAYANGETAIEFGLTLGTPVSAFEISAAINMAAPTLFVTLVEVALQDISPSWQSIIDIALNEKGTISESDISVTLV